MQFSIFVSTHLLFPSASINPGLHLPQNSMFSRLAYMQFSILAGDGANRHCCVGGLVLKFG
jgi:hypothetical protein